MNEKIFKVAITLSILATTYLNAQTINPFYAEVYAAKKLAKSWGGQRSNP